MTLNIIAANKRITELETENESLLKQVTEAKNAVENLQAMSVEMSESVEDLQSQVSDLKAENEALLQNHFKQVEALKEEIEKAAETASDKAIDLVASLGVPPDEIKVQAKDMTLTREEVLAKLNALTGKEQTEFYNANKHIIWSK